jgi:hypothetical protein
MLHMQRTLLQDAAYGRNQNEQVVSYFHAMFVKKGGDTKRGLVRLPTDIETKEVSGSPAGARFCLLVITALLTAREVGTISLTKLAT